MIYIVKNTIATPETEKERLRLIAAKAVYAELLKIINRDEENKTV